jgi:heat shock protein beta
MGLLYTSCWLKSIFLVPSTPHLTDKEDAKDVEEGEKVSDDDCKKFGTFYKQFGRAMKLGVIEDSGNRNRLAKLLRFKTSKSDDELISLDQYIARMKDGQKEIYFLGGGAVME